MPHNENCMLMKQLSIACIITSANTLTAQPCNGNTLHATQIGTITKIFHFDKLSYPTTHTHTHTRTTTDNIYNKIIALYVNRPHFNINDNPNIIPK